MTKIKISLFLIISCLISGADAMHNFESNEYYQCLNGCNIDLKTALSYENADCIKKCNQEETQRTKSKHLLGLDK